MTFTIPNAINATNLDQAKPDAGDFVALGDRRTGVISGGAVTAQASPNKTVVVAAADVVINGVPVHYAGTSSKTIADADTNPRFDLIGINSDGTLGIVRGTASSTSPGLPTFDPTTFCMLFDIYVHTTTISGTDLIDKRTMVETTFARTYADGTSTAISITENDNSKTLKVTSDGAVAWMNSKLTRTADYAMQWVTSLTMKSIDETNGPTPLVIKAGTVIAATTQRLIQFVSSSGTEKAYVNGAGQVYADNFKFGSGSPSGVVTGLKGDIYVDRAGPTMYMCQADGNSHWSAFQPFDASQSALPTGTIIPWLGRTIDAVPSGFVLGTGGSYVTTGGTYDALFALIGYRFGGSDISGHFNVPDLQGKILIGTGGAVNLGIGATAGGASVTLNVANLASHGHLYDDPGHRHSAPGAWVFAVDPHTARQFRLLLASSLSQPTGVPYADYGRTIDDISPLAGTGITIGTTGSGTPFSVLNPVHAANYLIKL